MYEVFLKCWYQEQPTEIQEERMYECDNIEDAWSFLRQMAECYIEFYPLQEMGIRLNKND